MTTIRNAKEVVLIKCQEIPESICVETRFITQAAAKQKKDEPVFYVTTKNGNFELIRQEDYVPATGNNSSAVTLGLQAKSTSVPAPSLQQTQNVGTIVPLVTTSANLNTGNSNKNSLVGKITSGIKVSLNSSPQMQSYNLNTVVTPAAPLGSSYNVDVANVMCTFNNQVQQKFASALNMNSIAIQCKLDDEIEDLDVEWPTVIEECLENVENEEAENESFRNFINENSVQYKNYKECLICGELCKSNKYFYGHMAIHQGPKILCSKCGLNLDSKKMLRQHKCRIAQKLEKAFLQCPHHSCNVKAISRLELYDHINEHSNNRMYKCSACRKGFCTSQEFSRHLLIRAKCYTSAKRKLFRVYGLEPQADRACRVRVFTLHTYMKCTTLVKTFLSQRAAKKGVCKICLRLFINKSVYNRHRFNCITKFRRRLKQKRSK